MIESCYIKVCVDVAAAAAVVHNDDDDER